MPGGFTHLGKEQDVSAASSSLNHIERKGLLWCQRAAMLYHGVPVQLPGGGSWDAAPRALGMGLLGK